MKLLLTWPTFNERLYCVAAGPTSTRPTFNEPTSDETWDLRVSSHAVEIVVELSKDFACMPRPAVAILRKLRHWRKSEISKAK